MIVKTMVACSLMFIITLVGVEGYHNLHAYNNLPMADEQFMNYLIEAQRLQKRMNELQQFSGPKIQI